MDATLFLFEVSVSSLLRYLTTASGGPLSPRTLQNRIIAGGQPVDWHLVLREGLRQHLHINLGIPGIEEPEDPIEENAAALYAALVMGVETIKVILSGEMELAVEAGLITDDALVDLRNQIRISS